LTKMGLMGIQLRIALKNEIPPEFELSESSRHDDSTQPQTTADVNTEASTTTIPHVASGSTGKDGETVLAQGNTNGQT
jgi:small subunit ribosomal protein S3